MDQIIGEYSRVFQETIRDILFQSDNQGKRIDPVALNMEIPQKAWDRYMLDLNAWNAVNFPRSAVWTELTIDEAPEAPQHFGFTPVVKRVLHPDGSVISFHETTKDGKKFAVTRVIDDKRVLFAICGTLPLWIETLIAKVKEKA